MTANWRKLFSDTWKGLVLATMSLKIFINALKQKENNMLINS